MTRLTIIGLCIFIINFDYLRAKESNPGTTETIGAEHDITDSEPAYNPKQKEKASNCYGYAVQDYNWYLSPKTPGGYDAADGCVALTKGFVADSKSKAREVTCPSIKGSSTPRCKKEEYLVMMFRGSMGPEIGYDFHFYRQDSNGFFSHQTGDDKPTNLDSDSKRINDPRKANRSHYDGSYDELCSCFCVNKGGFQL